MLRCHFHMLLLHFVGFLKKKQPRINVIFISLGHETINIKKNGTLGYLASVAYRHFKELETDDSNISYTGKIEWPNNNPILPDIGNVSKIDVIPSKVGTDEKSRSLFAVLPDSKMIFAGAHCPVRQVTLQDVNISRQVKYA